MRCPCPGPRVDQLLNIHNTDIDNVQVKTCEADYCAGSGNKALHYVECAQVGTGGVVWVRPLASCHRAATRGHTRKERALMTMTTAPRLTILAQTRELGVGRTAAASWSAGRLASADLAVCGKQHILVSV